MAADLAETRPRYATGTKHIRELGISPTGKRAVLEYRGEIVTVPAKKGDPHDLTQTSGVHERSPAWSPDGHSIAYFSDASGEYELIVPPAGRPRQGEVVSPRRRRILRAAGSGRPIARRSPTWTMRERCPGSSWTAARSSKVAADAIYGPTRAARAKYAWSPDSKWLTYSLTNRTGFQAVWLHEISSGKTHAVTDGLVEAGEPVFDRGGKYLYFLASTDAGPANNWFDQSFNDMLPTSSVYLVTLAKETPNPLLKETDEEGTEDTEKGKDAEAKGKDAEAKKKETPVVAIDLDGIAGRVVALPIPPGTIQGLAAGGEGQILYIRRADVRPGPAGRGKPSLKRFDLKTREEENLADGIDDFRVSADGKKLIYRAGDLGSSPPGAPSGPAGWCWGSSTRASSTRGTGPSSSMTSRCASSRGRNGPRFSARPGGSTATTSTPPTCTAPTGTPSGGSTRPSSPTSPAATTSTASSG